MKKIIFNKTVIKKILLSIFITVVTHGCVDEFNTATPQASSSILASKQNGFYISEAKKLQGGVLDIVDSVWIEKVWHYKIINGKKKKVSLSTNNQIILKLKNKYLF